MIRNCPYCERGVDIEDVSESGYYDCPYDDCSETFFFDKDTETLHKIEEQIEENIEDEIIIVCPNPDCRQELRIPNTTGTLQVTCPKCRTSFRYPTQSEGAQYAISELLAVFDEALEDEIKAVKTRGGNISLVMKNGKFTGKIAGGWGVYQFNIERKVPVIDETPAQIEIRGRNYRATIVSFLDFKLEIRILDFEEEEIPSALLSIDATYVLRKLKEVLPALESRDVDLALKTFNRIPVRCSQKEPVFILTDTNRNGLDDFQTKAIKICLGNEVAFIHGPPGTGKTRTLVNVVNDLANKGKKVLASCHTNIACDNVIEHFLRYEHENTVENLLNNGEIVRIGTPFLQNDRVKALTIEAIFENLSKDLQGKRERLTDLINSLIQKNELYYEYKQRFLEHKNLLDRIENCKENISESKDLIREYIQQEEELNQIISENKQLLSIAEGRNAVINFLKGTRPKNIRLDIAHFEDKKMSGVRNRLVEEKRLALLSAELQKLNSLVLKTSIGLPQGKKLEQIEEILKKTEGILENTKAKIADIDDRISKLNEGVLNNAKVVVSTLAKTFIDPILLDMQFDTVVIDEASIAPLPMLFYVCSLAKEKVLIFGDPNQLAPIKLADTDAAKKWLERDIFQEAGTRENKPHDPRTESLNNQYRMHNEIFKIVNRNFYGHLHNRRPEIDKDYHKYDNLLIPMPEHRVVIVDTSNANACVSTEKTGPRSRSRYNLYHVEVIEKVLHDLIDGNYIRQEDIGIITPYKSQAGFLRQMLRESGFEKVDIGVVHSFQGIERPYIIFDLVEALGVRKIGILVNDKHEFYLKKDQSENEAKRLLTVAFSRPQEKLLIISHNQHMLDNLPKGSVPREIIADLSKHGHIIDSPTLVPYYVPADEHPDIELFNGEELLGKEAVFNQKSFYPSLIRDLKNAQKEVLFISGYMTTNRMEKLVPYLANLLSRGVIIGIITKPPWEQMSRERELEGLYDRLRNMRIDIQEHYGTHEKIVAIDGHILYAGSLNVLSFNHNSKEMMIRSDSKSKLQKVFSVLAKNYPKMRECLTKSGCIVKPVLTPQKFLNILDRVRPKHRELPKNKPEAKEYYRSMLKKLRWVIADDRRVPNFAVLFNDTIENMLNDPPKTVEQLLSLPEFMRNRTNIRGYEDIVVEILKEYRKSTNKKNQKILFDFHNVEASDDIA